MCSNAKFFLSLSHSLSLPLHPLLGPDCSVSVPANGSYWTRSEFAKEAGLARASHKAVVDQGVMWVIGGYVFNASDYHMVKA